MYTAAAAALLVAEAPFYARDYSRPWTNLDNRMTMPTRTPSGFYNSPKPHSHSINNADSQ